MPPKSPLILLHGAIGSKQQLEHLKDSLSLHFEIHPLNFPGHGREEMTHDFSIPAFAKGVKNHIEEAGLNDPYIFGYSMGGYVALYMAHRYPGLVSKVATLATKFDWNPAAATAETTKLDPDRIEQKVPNFARALADMHGTENWKGVLQQTAALLNALGKTPLLTKEILADTTTPVLLMVGDRDKMVSIEETLAAYSLLTSAQLAVLPDTPHPIENAPVALITRMLHSFLS